MTKSRTKKSSNCNSTDAKVEVEHSVMSQVLLAIFFSFVLPLAVVMYLSSITDVNSTGISSAGSSVGFNDNGMKMGHGQRSSPQSLNHQQGGIPLTNSGSSRRSSSYGIMHDSSNGLKQDPKANGAISPDQSQYQSHTSQTTTNKKAKSNLVVVSQDQLDAIEKVEQLQQKIKELPNDLGLWTQLGVAQIIRDSMNLTGGSASMDFVDSFQKALVLAGMRSGMLSKSNPDSKELITGTATRCQILDYLASGYEASRLIKETITTRSQIIDHLQCTAEMRYTSLVSRAKNLITKGDYAGAYRDLADILKGDDYLMTLLKNRTKHPFLLMTSLLEGDESVVPNGWQWLIDESGMILSTLETVLTIADDDPMQPRSLMSVVLESIQDIHRGLFTYYDKKTNDTKQAWYHLNTANKLKRHYTAFTNQETRDVQINERISFYNKKFFNTLSKSGIDSKTPIFIIGFPRSGTTLLETIVDSHSMVAGLGEASALMNMLPEIHARIPHLYNLSGVEHVRGYLETTGSKILAAMQSRFEDLGESDDVIKSPNVKYLIDKQNVNYQFIPYIHLLFPNAIIINVVREPMDVLFSNYRLDLSSVIPGEGRTDATSDFKELSDYYKMFRRVMRAWDEVLPDRVTHIRYDDLVNDSENVIRSLLDMLGLEWNPEMLKFHERKLAIFTPSNNQVRKPMYKDSIQRWKKYEEQLQPLKTLIGDDAEWNQPTTLLNYTS